MKAKSPNEIKREVRSLGWWYQSFEITSGVMTGLGKSPSYYPESRWKLLEEFLPRDLTGKTVLDVGGNAGYFSLQMMKRGARSCTLVEPYVEFAAQARYIADLYEYDIRVINEDVHTWCLTTSERFDYVIFLGLFYHLKYPGIVLDRLAEMTRERLLFQSHIIGEHPLNYDGDRDYAPGRDDGTLSDPAFPRMLFVENLYNGDPTNWWIPNATALEPLLRSAGMAVIGRPHPQLLIAEPNCVPGKVVLENGLVFPKYRKPGGDCHPGPQRVDPDLWSRLLRDMDDPA